jgi:hypothetical protein
MLIYELLGVYPLRRRLGVRAFVASLRSAAFTPLSDKDAGGAHQPLRLADRLKRGIHQIQLSGVRLTSRCSLWQIRSQCMAKAQA